MFPTTQVTGSRANYECTSLSISTMAGNQHCHMVTQPHNFSFCGKMRNVKLFCELLKSLWKARTINLMHKLSGNKDSDFLCSELFIS